MKLLSAFVLFVSFVLILSGCAGSPADTDFRSKVADVVPASMTVTGTPPSVHFDFARVDFRDPSLSGTTGLAK